jgi:hypothetical protein
MFNITTVLIITLAHLLIITTSYAQSPNKMSYQAVIRNSSNALIASTLVGMQISILQGSATGTVVYAETQSPTTDVNGLATIEIGTGTIVTGTFATINWANSPFFIKIETDPAGGTTYTITGTSEFLSVPYALFSATSPADLIYPTGLSNFQGVVVTNGATYVVPTDKVLYITNWSTTSSATMYINGIVVGIGPALYTNYVGLRMPFILSAGMNVNAGGFYWSGFLVDKNPVITPILINNNYTVPVGKNFVVMNYFTQSGGPAITVNGVPFFYNPYSNLATSNNYTALYSPVVLPAGTVIGFSGGMSLQGYLR